MVLQWLTLARRPLEWREIQVLKSIDRREQSIDFERQRFHVDAKDLCGPLVNVSEDGTVELIHLTAKQYDILFYTSMTQWSLTIANSFLVDEGIVDPLHGDIRMASLCIDYLNLPIFVGSISSDAALRGDYGFMEYAALYWIRHLEGAIAEAKRRIARTKLQEIQQPEDSDDSEAPLSHPNLQEDEYSRIMSPLAESLGVFIEHHWISPKSYLAVSDRNKRNLQVFESLDFHEELQQVFVSTRKQLHSFGPIKKEELSTDIMEVIKQVRAVIEDSFSMSQGSGPPKDMVDRYGQGPFRCARFSCRSFTLGFPTPDEREIHVARHERPHRCNDEKCEKGFDIGFASLAQYKRHMKDYHPDRSQRDHEFPTDKEIQLSIRSKNTEPQAQVTKQTTDTTTRDNTAPQGNATVVSDGDESSPAASEPEIRPRPAPKRHSKDDLKCQYCGKEFTRLYNLKSHLLVHQNNLRFPCEYCHKSFVRKSDFNRHMKSHTGEKKWVCGGCDKAFARSETLKAHQQQSKKGQACLEDLQRRQQEQIEEQDLILPSISSFLPN
ncbi:hypothetical protein N7509_003766 [Penicillium cosmopolitanum]|uniref:C2H2-type domain-containing protein n=1 Tax=Penicillium cosmopolitanum TaxID=1131564 RepID=A0A9W9W5P5_9EURO|nr:uncharacterized protein N7509_003766 [Penicillium cosmopolitanum]KAJ5403895.1 hypothetical protein N7509_003766 [Penicillium cosmopolitanum]